MKRHISVLADGDIPTAKKFSGLFHCPYCKYKGAKYIIDYHIKGHSSVKHREFTVIKCGLSCRSVSHFHCCYCAATIVNRSQFVKHLAFHQEQEHAVADVEHPEGPVKHPVAPMKHPEAPMEHPEAPMEHPEAPMEHPEAPMEHTEAPMELPEVPVVHPEAPPEHPQTPIEHAQVLGKYSEIPQTSPACHTIQLNPSKFLITCPHCRVKLYKKNFKTHCKRKHTFHFETVSKDRFLNCECVDATNGVFAVEESFCGSGTPIHVVKNSRGATQKVMCEVEQCRLNSDLALRSGMLLYECHHIGSLFYCPCPHNQIVTLTEGTLETMVENKWFGEESKASLLRCQQKADEVGVPLSVQLTVGGPPSHIHISVYEPIITYYSRLGRVIVSYDTQENSWHCPCCVERQPCKHKGVAKWHLFATKRELFQKARCPETTNPPRNATAGNPSECKEDAYPPDDKTIGRMLNYLLTNKTLPAELPQALIELSRGGKTQESFPKHLIPKETNCAECEYRLSDQQLITSEGKILTSTGVVEGISTYRRSCLNCGLMYRYQEWEDGFHNFDDHILLSLHLCLIFRNALQTGVEISKIIQIIEATEGVSFPPEERVLQAYLHFEALSNHDYTYSCVSCGYSPAVVVMDVHKNGVFDVPVCDLQSAPEDYDGRVDIVTFWGAVATEMISHGFIASGRKNPFVVPLSYHHWSPWIGSHTRRSNLVLNTEFEKNKLPGGSEEDEPVDEERLTDALGNLKVEEVRTLCEQCGVDNHGSKMELVVRLWKKMSNRAIYNKLLEKVWGASGNWAVITCPCGIVYSLKFNLRTESPRDFVDLLLSWKHFPNVTVCDYAGALALHANRRQPGIFGLFQGRLLDPTPQNIKQVSDGSVHVNLPWLKSPKMPSDTDGHPLTGCSQHLSLNGTSGAQMDLLRQLELVPELVGSVSSRRVEQLFLWVREKNNSLKTMTPSTHLFLQRNLLHHHNMEKNKSAVERYSEIVPADVEMQWDDHGRLVLGHSLFPGKPSRRNGKVHQAPAKKSLKGLQSQILDETESPAEHVAVAGNTKLTRSGVLSQLHHSACARPRTPDPLYTLLLSSPLDPGGRLA
ncbi:uncharacterized protein LOC130527698 [Takifugu flavidus]|uniref:uncharacterized protein LOC130527698 n=1 Tax=Takifugu flavidus TaxID=433684 RepID=UPI002544C770|nr:uncharacterized protein LOC130527698 [Takifugu flavidus]